MANVDSAGSANNGFTPLGDFVPLLDLLQARYVGEESR
jgi:hypothetical protein